MLLKTSEQLSKSEAVAEFLGVPVGPERGGAVYAMMFLAQLAFVVSHEYTHHVHGHALQSTPHEGNDDVDLQEQATEIDADGYAVFHVLAHFIAGEGRSHAIELSHCNLKQTSEQDEFLLSLVVMAIGAFLLATSPVVVEPSKIYKLKHPPQVVRMDFILRNVMRWINQNRNGLEASITQHRFQMMMALATEATWGINGGRDWSKQIAFVKSESGAEYVGKLEKIVTNLVQSA